MFISHIALWTKNLEDMRTFYIKYFGGISNNKYTNTAKGFSSYFISFKEGPSMELMSKIGIENSAIQNTLGFCHIAFKLGSKQNVIDMTAQLAKDGIKIISQPRTTGDGYFESIIADPDDNEIELVA